MKKVKLTKETLSLIMELTRKGDKERIIAKKIGASQAFISVLKRAYNGNEKALNLLAKEHQLLIKETSPFFNKNAKSEFVEYHCKILWGLVTLKFKPKLA